VASVVATPADNTRVPFLAAFVCLLDNPRARGDLDDIFLLRECLDVGTIDALHKLLASALPQYMIPKVYIPLSAMPLNTSGKIDRKYLQTVAADLTFSDFEYYSGTAKIQKSLAVTANEYKMQNLWEELLKLPPGTIGRNDSFIRLGGDSILATRLVALCRQEGLRLTVADIVGHPVLMDMVNKCTKLVDQGKDDEADVYPFR
jgi:aryl carrier-like protein